MKKIYGSQVFQYGKRSQMFQTFSEMTQYPDEK